MNIRVANKKDLDTVFAIYDRARKFMREHGNPDQWGDVYPSNEIINDDIRNENLYIVEGDEGDIAGVFAYFPDGDPDYDDLNGEWLNDEPYVAIHRIASAGTQKGVFSRIVEFCLERASNIKVDTYMDNIVMQSALKKHGFILCGTISVEGMEFLAYQLVKKS